MYRRRVRVFVFSVAVLLAAGSLAACGDSGSSSKAATPAHNATDVAYVAAMEHHHTRAIEVGQLAAEKGSDPRVRDFGNLIVSQQTPELTRLRDWTRILPAAPADQATPDGYIDDAALARLKSESGVVFDRDVLLSSASSETGAAAMSQRELASGRYDPARTLATSIATAPTTQIPKLRELAAALPG